MLIFCLIILICGWDNLCWFFVFFVKEKNFIKFWLGLIKVKFLVYKFCKIFYGSEGVDKMGFLWFKIVRFL